MSLGALSFGAIWLFAAVACLSIAAQGVLYFGLAAWLFQLWRDRRRPEFPAPLGLGCLFLAWTLAASLASPNQAHSLETWRKWLLAFAAFYVADQLATARALKAVLGSLLFFSALWCLGASLVYGAKPFLFWQQGQSWAEVSARWLNDIDWRAASGSGGYQVLATCSTLLLLFYTGLLLEDPWWRRPLVYGCLACIALALLLTLTRGAWLATAAGLMFLFAWKKPALLFLSLALVLAGALVLQHSPFMGRLKSVLDKDNDSNRERVYMAQAGISILREHPWLGVGDSMESFERGGVTVPGNFITHRSPEALQWYAMKRVGDKEQGHLHNNFIQIAAMAGLPGLGLLLLFFARLGWRAFKDGLGLRQAQARPLAVGLCGALLGWWVNGAFEYNFGSYQSSFVLWFLIGLYFAARRQAAS
jgi:O-antigen ligase